MEVSAIEIKPGQIIYGITMVGYVAEFGKFTVSEVTKRNNIRGKLHDKDGLPGHERILDYWDWRFFTNFESARDVWIDVKLSRDIARAETDLENLQNKKAELLSKSDL